MTAEPAPEPRYRDADAPVAERVENLLEVMTREEKVAQLGSAWVFEVVDGKRLSPTDAERLLSRGIGHITRVSGASNLRPAEAARVANQIQRHLVEETRLGIPAIIHEEVCSGLMARDATVFPQAIGVASTWDPALAEEMAAAIRTEMLAVGARQGLAPVLDICRDPRWGRTEETFGEDPHLVATMGTAFVRGLQGPDLRSGVVATAKHLVGYGASEGGLNWAPAHIPTRELHDVYLHPFRAAVAAGLRSVMPAYQELDGVPVSADRSLVEGLLRETWDFEGTVVSDYFAIRQLATYHRVVADASSAAALALDVGIDVELPGTDCYGKPLLDALEQGLVSEALVDRAVERVLTTKFELGLFDNPYVEVESADFAYPRHLELARTIARKSVVLLANDGILPLRAEKVAVIGPNADRARHLFGDYTYPSHVESLREMKTGDNIFNIPIPPDLELSGAEGHVPTVFEALAARLDGEVAHTAGCDVNGDSAAGFDEAVALAARSDVAVLVMGDKAGLTDDSTSGESRDRVSLDLPGVQEELVRAVVATGTPVVLVLVGGRPMASEWAHEHSSAVVMAWLPGPEGAGAIADVLVGAHDPGGRLPISYPRSTGQIPLYHSHKVSGGRSHWKGDYVDSPSSPLYPFGHGLSYTSFSIEASVEPAAVAMDGWVTVTARVTNTGDRDGEEVVQVYTRDLEASVTRPVSELKAFARVEVPAGTSRTVSFSLGAGQFGFHGRDLDYVVEPGEFEVYVGRSAAERQPAGRFTIMEGSGSVTVAFQGQVTIRSDHEEED